MVEEIGGKAWMWELKGGGCAIAQHRTRKRGVREV